MLNLNTQQKQILLGSGVLVLILGIVTFTSSPNFRYQEPPLPEKPSLSLMEAQAYLRYVENLKIDPQASRALFQQILTQEDIKKEVENELQVGQTVKEATLEASKLAKSEGSGEQAVVDYLSKLTGSALNFNTNAKAESAAMFSADINTLASLKGEQEKMLAEIYALPSPTETLKLQAAVAKAYSSYGELISVAMAYAKGETDKPWPDLYNQYSAINEQFKAVAGEVAGLSKKYQIASLQITPAYAFGEDQNHFRLIKEAHALFGVGDVSITVGDIPRIIKEAVEEGLTTSFANFMGSMLNKLIAKIESNYLIANFLYYTDALVAGQYTDDYLEKYVQDGLDRQIIKRFIPQFSCGAGTADLAPFFQAKAQEYLGFDIESLRPSDPQFYEKLNRIGDPLSFASSWEKYYESIAEQAQSEAEKAADRELTSPGLKTPRDTVNSAIAISINNITSASQASLNAIMNLGISNAKSFISGFVSQLTQNLLNKFVFKGVIANGGALGVLKEQSTCLAAAQLSPVLPVEAIQYVAPNQPPTQEELLEQECAKYPRGCTVLPNNPVTEPENP